MARPKRTGEQELYDRFCAWAPADRAAALKVLTELDRQKRKDETRQAATPGPAEIQRLDLRTVDGSERLVSK